MAAVNKTKVYGSADPALTYTVPAGTLETGDSFSRRAHPCSGRVGRREPRPHHQAGLRPRNYELTVTPGTFTISQKPITVAAVNKTKVYGSADPALTYTVPAGTLETGDSFSGELTRAAGESVAGSPYAITKGSLSAGNNYELTVTPGTFTISQKPITWATSSRRTKVYVTAKRSCCSDSIAR